MDNKLAKRSDFAQNFMQRFFEDDFWHDDFFNFLEDRWNMPSLTPSKNFATKAYDKFVDEKTGEKVLQVGLPGFNKEDISIGLDGDTIFIKGEMKNEDAKKFYKNSISYSTVDSNIDSESINASLENGILEIRYKTQEGKEPKRIEIK